MIKLDASKYLGIFTMVVGVNSVCDGSVVAREIPLVFITHESEHHLLVIYSNSQR